MLAILLIGPGCGEGPSGPDADAEPSRRAAFLGAGPIISLRSNIVGNWRTGQPAETREAFIGQGLRFEWSAVPGPSGSPVAGFSYAVDDTSEWSPWSLGATEWPLQPKSDENLWFPTSGMHTFFLRAIDEASDIRLLVAEMDLFPGPQFCEISERYILVVLDTNPDALVMRGLWPPDYESVERTMLDDWFSGYDYQVYATGGTEAPPISSLDCASSVFWFHSTDVASGDPSALRSLHTEAQNVLPSYRAAGGNLFLCGLQPSQALRYFESAVDPDSGPILQGYPIDFETTLTDPTLRPHWAITTLGIARIEGTVDGSMSSPHEPLRIKVAHSVVTTGGNTYPDLRFDPTTWYGRGRGFGHFDRGMAPSIEHGAETIYTRNDTGVPVGVRRLTSPGINGNTVVLGLHPYFVETAAFSEFLAAVLTDFGETSLP